MLKLITACIVIINWIWFWFVLYVLRDGIPFAELVIFEERLNLLLPSDVVVNASTLL